MTKRRLRIIFLYGMAAFATAVLFFDSAWSLLFLLPVLGYEIHYQELQQKDRERLLLTEQFKDGLQCLLASLEAGYSVENSFLHAAGDIRMMYAEREPIVREFDRIRRQLGNGQNIEELLLQMGERNDSEDIRNFATVFVTAKRTGGDIISVIRSVTNDIYRKNEIRKEIQTVVYAKEFEANIMKAMPYAILLYFRVFSPGFLDPLYSGLFGRIVMGGVFLGYYVLGKLADRIVKIDI